MGSIERAVRAAAVMVSTTRGEFLSFLEAPPRWEAAHLTALAWVVDPAERSLLLVRHREVGWSCPGGHVESGESPDSAVVRELREETGLTLTPVRLLSLGRLAGCAQIPDATHWAVGYLFHASTDRPLKAEPGQRAAWFRLDALPAPCADDVDVVVEHLRRAVRDNANTTPSATPWQG